MSKPKWKYGFYDTAPQGDWMSEPKPQDDPTIYWYVFGMLTHDDAESAEHTARKSVWGQPVIVRRRGNDATEWEHAPGYGPTGRIRETAAVGTQTEET